VPSSNPPSRNYRNELTRRRAIQLGTGTALGLSFPQLLHSRVGAAGSERSASSVTARGFGKAKSVIMLWLLGGISQVESWDPKPNAPKEVRGEFGVIRSAVPGIQLGELLPKTARVADQLALLRAVVTNDNGHSSSGYHMLTGVPHVPPGQDNIEPRFPNFAPSQAALVKAIKPDVNGLPSAIALPYHIRTDAGTPWPGQWGGDLGPKADPWLLNCDPVQPGFQAAELALPEGTSKDRLDARKQLLGDLQRPRGGPLPLHAARFAAKSEQAFDLLSSAARRPFLLDQEPTTVRDRYGRYRFGQSALLARRLTEAGVSLVQVNWTRIDGYDAEGAWDTHGDHCKCARSFLMPMFDQTFSALIEDLQQRGRLDETLVVALSEFGRTPRFNKKAGRDHWGSCFSVALAGGGVRGGVTHGESDRIAAAPLSGAVTPADLISTILHCLGIAPDTVVPEQSGRPLYASRGHTVHDVL
jgi:hypothetical protein